MDELPFLFQTRLAASVRIRRERMLPVPGEVIVSIGTRVEPLDLVARSIGPTRLKPIPLARYMHTNEATLSKYLERLPGEEVEERDIIASKPEAFGTLRRIYRAPSRARIAAVQGIWMTLEINDAPIELTALYRGTVVNMMPRLGVVIEATGALAQGVWGSGTDGYGTLKRAVDSPEQVLSEEIVDVTTRGAMLLGGSGVTEEALRRAAQEHVAGVIVGGLAPGLEEVVSKLRIPVLVTDGFGERPMTKPIFDLLAAHDGEEASLSTRTHLHGGTTRPEVFVPAHSTAAGSPSVNPLAALTPGIGSVVRVTCLPYEGKTGTITSIPKLPQTLESGILAWGVEVELEGERIFVPLQDLEVIG